MKAKKVYESFERSGDAKSSMGLGLKKKIKELMERDDFHESDYIINDDNTVSLNKGGGWVIYKESDDVNSEFYIPEWFRIRDVNGVLWIDESFYKFIDGKPVLDIDKRLMPINMDSVYEIDIDIDEWIQNKDNELGMSLSSSPNSDILKFWKEYRSNPNRTWQVISGEDLSAESLNDIINEGWKVYDTITNNRGEKEAIIYNEG